MDLNYLLQITTKNVNETPNTRIYKINRNLIYLLHKLRRVKNKFFDSNNSEY